MGNPHVFYRLGILTEDLLQDVIDEAQRAHEKHGPNSMLYGSDAKGLRILMEEVGEVARAMNEFALANIDLLAYQKELRAELVQCAAMCTTWIARLDSPSENALDFTPEIAAADRLANDSRSA
jgi:NTP pyrophosphatase (non-canonical NTP hydrolase)